jgi:hypothetical protein
MKPLALSNCPPPPLVKTTFFSLSISRKCECGLYGDCFDPDKWCNCDSGHDGWLYDGGELMVSLFSRTTIYHRSTPMSTRSGILLSSSKNYS